MNNCRIRYLETRLASELLAVSKAAVVRGVLLDGEVGVGEREGAMVDDIITHEDWCDDVMWVAGTSGKRSGIHSVRGLLVSILYVRSAQI